MRLETARRVASRDRTGNNADGNREIFLRACNPIVSVPKPGAVVYLLYGLAGLVLVCVPRHRRRQSARTGLPASTESVVVKQLSLATDQDQPRGAYGPLFSYRLRTRATASERRLRIED